MPGLKDRVGVRVKVRVRVICTRVMNLCYCTQNSSNPSVAGEQGMQSGLVIKLGKGVRSGLGVRLDQGVRLGPDGL